MSEQAKQCDDPQCACATYPMLHSLDDGQTVTVTPNPSHEPLFSRPSRSWLPIPEAPRPIRLRREGNRMVMVD